MKVVQFFKTYNFHVVQIFTRSKDFKNIFKSLKEFELNKENTFLVAKFNEFRAYLQQSCQSNDY